MQKVKNSQSIMEFLQSTATSNIGRVDMQVISDFISSKKSVNWPPQYRKWTDKEIYITSGNIQQKMAMLMRSGNSKQSFQTWAKVLFKYLRWDTTKKWENARKKLKNQKV